MDSSYISHFRDSTPSFFLHSYLNYIELLSILRQKYNPVTTKTDIGGEKMKREDEIEDKNNMHTVQKGDSFLVGQKGRERNSLSDTKDCRWRICKAIPKNNDF